MKNFLARILFLALMIGGGIAFFYPELLPISNYQASEQLQRRDIFISQVESKAGKVLGVALEQPDKLPQVLSAIAENPKAEIRLDNLPQEVTVEQLFELVLAEMAKVPENQLERAKVQVCEDIIAAYEAQQVKEATQSESR